MDSGKGTQYFWLSKDCYDFFPPLTVRNTGGVKATYSCIVTMRYVDEGVVDSACRVTFEAENNLDFRLGTGLLRYLQRVRPGDLAAVSRVRETIYELRLYRRESLEFKALVPYAVHFIGHRRKRYGYVANAEFERLTGKKTGL